MYQSIEMNKYFLIALYTIVFSSTVSVADTLKINDTKLNLI